MLELLKRAFHSFCSLFEPIVVPLPTVPFNGLNFNTQCLCPETLPVDTIQEWVSVYLRKLKRDSLVIWANPQNQLMVSYSHSGNITQVCLPECIIHAEPNRVMLNETPIQTLNAIRDELFKVHGQTFPLTIHVPDADDITRLKSKVYLSHNLVFPEMIEELRTLTAQLQQNFEQFTHCAICIDDFTPQAPAMTLIEKGSIYHGECLQEHFNTRRRMRDSQGLPLPLTDPIDGATIDSGQIAPANGFMTLLNDTQPLFKILKQYSKILRLILEENQTLKSPITSTKETSSSLR